jgi:ribonuclease VapC
MIAVDPSALLAILLGEDDASDYAMRLEQDDQPLISAASLVELHAVARKKLGERGREVVNRLMGLAEIQVVEVTKEQALIAIEAGYRYGVLNFGDTFSYALAKQLGIPLLFKGKDFVKTDVAKIR